ncbi:MAG: hypothetical protein AB7F83_12810 [Lysobacterales bacterium]
MSNDLENGAERSAEAKKANWLHRRLAGFYAVRESARAHPVWGTVLALLTLVVGVMAAEAYDYGKRQLLGPDEFLAQIAESQTREFADLKKNLGQIQSAIDRDDRAAFNNLKNAIRSIEQSNVELIQQLMLAKRENDTMRSLAEQRTGVTGGYDFILTESGGIRLDRTTTFGIQYVGESYVTANLSAIGAADAKQVDLKSGQSLGYQGADQRQCKVSLLSIRRADIGTASFAVNCR